MEEFEIVIIGAGPGGLNAANVLAGKKDLLVLEKNPEIGPKVCAGGLTSKDFELGIPTSLAERTFSSIKIHSPFGTEEINSDKILVGTCKRERFNQWLLERVKKKGVEVRTNSKVIKIQEKTVLLEDGREIKFNYLIGADGSNSVVRKHLELPLRKVGMGYQYILPSMKNFEKLEMFFFPKYFSSLGLAWIFPYRDSFSIGCGANRLKIPPERLLTNFKNWLFKMGVDFNGKLEGFPINADYRGFQFGNKFLVGDAAGLASELTGQGIYPALISGEEVAKKILDPNYSCPKIGQWLKIKKEHGQFSSFLGYGQVFVKVSRRIVVKFLKRRLKQLYY